MRTHNRISQAAVTPAMALATLREGNARFAQNLRTHRDLLEQVNATREGQFPFATILSCIDSRTSAELTFDQGLGDIFSIRIAGNVINDDILGSMEFACKIAGSRLLVVLGHTGCGAIKGACDHVQLGNLSTLLNKIGPAVYLERETQHNRTSKNTLFVERVAQINIHRSVEAVIERSQVLREMVLAGDVGLIGANYSVETGVVEFFDDTYMCGEVKHMFLDVPPARAAVDAA